MTDLSPMNEQQITQFKDKLILERLEVGPLTQEMLNILHFKGSQYFNVIATDGTPVGELWLMPGEEYIEVLEIRVQAEFKRRGYGREALNAARRRWEMLPLRLSVDPANLTAQSFYSACNMVPTAITYVSKR